MNDGVIGIVFSLVYVSLKEFGVVGSDMYTWGIKDFHKCWLGSLAKRRLCPGTAGVINCTPLICIVLLSEFVSRNAWLQQEQKLELAMTADREVAEGSEGPGKAL